MLENLDTEITKGVCVTYAGPNDTCNLCVDEYVKANYKENPDVMNPVRAREELRGKLYGHKVFKIKRNGFVVCADHIAKISELLKEEQDAED